MSQPTVADIGELELLRRLQPFCSNHQIGDDAAVLTPENGANVITTDVLVDGVHFSDRTTSPEDIGWRAIAVNLSDLAAMGAFPIGVTIGLSVPGETPVAWIEQVYQGMTACLKTHGGEILGGDVVQSPLIALAITAVGQVSPHRVIRRDQAQPGQVIVATGPHGGSRAGLELLLHPTTADDLTEATRSSLIQAHQRPTPRFDVIRQLDALGDDAFGAIAGMDSSDGLANAVLHLCQASGVGARLMRSRLPMPSGLAAWVGKQTAQEWCLYGGEDFELVLCLPTEIGTKLRSQLGENAAIVGTIESDSAVLLVDDLGDSPDQVISWDSCFQHF